MTMKAERKGIGSFFETEAPSVEGQSFALPWSNTENISYVQTGRQALAVVADAYAAEGRNVVLVPDYLCESMLVPFAEEQWTVQTYRLTDTFKVDFKDLMEKISSPSKTVILSAVYFGNEPTYEHLSTIDALKKLNVRVIEDETHRVLGSLKPVGDVGIASLRKVLPVADGAYIRGNVPAISPIPREHQGWEAMDRKRAGEVQLANQIFREANGELEEWIRPPATISSRTLSCLSTLDYAELRSRRRKNSQILRDCLRETIYLEVLNFAEVPSHLVIRVPHAKFLQNRLAKVGIYCPIHWPQPSRLSGIKWRDNLLSLPVDHRYGETEMRLIVDQIKLLETNC